MRRCTDLCCRRCLARRNAAPHVTAVGCALGLAALPAQAVRIWHDEAIVFDSRGFEYEVLPGPARYPRIGTWAHTRDAGQMPDGGSMLLTDAAVPGAAQGRIYQRLTRFSDQVNSDAVLAGGVISGTLRAEWMARIPAESNVSFNGTVFWVNAVGAPAGDVCINGSGTVQALNAAETAWVATGVPYLVNQWQKWPLKWTIGQTMMTLTVAANSALIPAKSSPGVVTQLRLTSGGGGATLYVDSAAPDETVPFGILDVTWTLGADHPSYRKGGHWGSSAAWWSPPAAPSTPGRSRPTSTAMTPRRIRGQRCRTCPPAGPPSTGRPSGMRCTSPAAGRTSSRKRPRIDCGGSTARGSGARCPR